MHNGLVRALIGATFLTGFIQAHAGVTHADLNPILQRHCVMCHAGESAASGLRLDTLDGLLAGGRNGPVVVAGRPEASELMRRLTGESAPRMPMTGPPFLPDDQIARFGQWIAAGLPPGDRAAAPAEPAAPRRAPGPGEIVTYADVAPIFAMRCAKCHTDGGLTGPPPEGYRLTSHAETLAPFDRARVVPGNPGASELMRRVRGQALPRMPHDGPPWLDETEINLIERWIADGARDAEGQPTANPEGARVRLHGRLGPHRQLDGLELVLTGRTRIDNGPRPGDYVEVRGVVDAAGGIVVERLRKR